MVQFWAVWTNDRESALQEEQLSQARTAQPGLGPDAVHGVAPAAGQPLFVGVKEAARMLAINPWSVYRLLDSGDLEGRYHGRRRLVVYRSLLDYAQALPTEAPAS